MDDYLITVRDIRNGRLLISRTLPQTSDPELYVDKCLEEATAHFKIGLDCLIYRIVEHDRYDFSQPTLYCEENIAIAA